MKKRYCYFGCLLLLLCGAGCNEERILTPNTHDGRVPEVINFSARIDSSAAKPIKFIVWLNWSYDTLRYGVNPNLKNWEVYRIIGYEDTLTVKFQLQKFVQVPTFGDSSVSIQPGNRDSVVILYRVIPVGNVDANNIQFTGKPSDIVRVSIKKK
jgi:hypothetical protein